MEVVLVNPEIPQNTGSIARTCAATSTHLHLIEPLGFELSEKRIRRAGLDYWPYVKLSVHHDWEAYCQARPEIKYWFLSKFGSRLYYQADFQGSDALVFGSETRGLGESFLQSVPPDRVLRIPMPCPQVRSLNLSNAVALVLYAALQQTGQV